MSLNIQRGRDHGLAPYNDWREICGLSRFSSWEQMTQEMDTDTVQRLSRYIFSCPFKVLLKSEKEDQLLDGFKKMWKLAFIDF